MRFRALAGLVFAFGSSALPCAAQLITAKVVGTVTDPSGGVIPAARVTIRSQETNQARTAATGNAGDYEFSFLPIGSYTLSVEAAGFQRADVTAFHLDVDQVARVNLKMTVGQAAEAWKCRPRPCCCRPKMPPWEQSSTARKSSNSR